MIDLKQEDMQLVKDIIRQSIPGLKVWAFGSRVKGTAKKFSDLDLVVIGSEKLDWKIIESLKDKFSASSLPIMVDIIDWNTIDERFKKIIEQKYEVIQS